MEFTQVARLVRNILYICECGSTVSSTVESSCGLWLCRSCTAYWYCVVYNCESLTAHVELYGYATHLKRSWKGVYEYTYSYMYAAYVLIGILSIHQDTDNITTVCNPMRRLKTQHDQGNNCSQYLYSYHGIDIHWRARIYCIIMIDYHEVPPSTWYRYMYSCIPYCVYHDTWTSTNILLLYYSMRPGIIFLSTVRVYMIRYGGEAVVVWYKLVEHFYIVRSRAPPTAVDSTGCWDRSDIVVLVVMMVAIS